MHSKSVKKRISRSCFGSKNHNAVAVVCVETQEKFDCIADAARFYNIDDSHIAKCCKGKRNVVGGLHWQYATTDKKGERAMIARIVHPKEVKYNAPTIVVNGVMITHGKIYACTPGMANALLTANKQNRKKNNGDCKQYARDVQAGDWSKNQQPITFSTDGVLRDGQHRLDAISRGTETVEILIHILPKEHCRHFDEQRKRLQSETLQMENSENAEAFTQQICAAVKFLSKVRKDATIRPTNKYTDGELKQAILSRLDSLRCFTSEDKYRKNAAIFAAEVLAYESGLSEDNIKEAVDYLFYGTSNRSQLNKKLANLHIAFSKKTTQAGEGRQSSIFLQASNMIRYYCCSKGIATLNVSELKPIFCNTLGED